MTIKRLLACVMVAALLLTSLPALAVSAVEDPVDLTTVPDVQDMTSEAEGDVAILPAPDAEANDGELLIASADAPSYEAYLIGHEDAMIKADPIVLTKDAVVADSVSKTITLPLTVEKEGLYTLAYEYIYTEQGNKTSKFAVELDGQVPFEEVSSLVLSRVWTNAQDIYVDEHGDDVSPEQVEVTDRWTARTLYDREGKYNTPLTFYMRSGAHTLSLVLNYANVSFRNVRLEAAAALPTYSEYKSSHGGASAYTGEDILIQGESARYKSEMYLVAQNDITSPLTTPYSASNIKLNTVGGGNWKLTGERITWVVDAPNAGFYKLGIRWRQNMYDGVDVHRRLYINGEIPCEEANVISFPYNTEWQSFCFGESVKKGDTDKEALMVYLEKGENELSLECDLGTSAEISTELENSVLELNSIYRDIVMVTGSTPDNNRDYSLAETIPDLLDNLQAAVDRLSKLADTISENYGSDSSLISKIQNVIAQIEKMITKPDNIPRSDTLDSFKSNIAMVGSWISTFREQPLEIDCLTLTGEGGTAPRATANFGENFMHGWDRFVASFVVDYTSMGSTAGKQSIKVWMQSGRDQANVIKQLITSDFSATTGIGVNLELVTGALIEATLAGKGPDVALTRVATDPVNFAMRGALYDLSQFGDYQEVTERFVDGATIPFQYKGGTYALPETMTYQMMFCRTDILDELGLTPPSTWDELLSYTYPIVSRSNMQVGIGNMNAIAAMNASNIFTNLLYQMGGQLYTDDLTKTALDTQTAYSAFNKSVEMYRDYMFPQEYDAMNRFRTGEMPILLADYTMYNTFSIAIPELDGLWEMYPIPGTQKDDGTVDNSQASTVTASVMFNHIQYPEAGWEFLKWWTSAETQAKFGMRIEAALGSAGRYATANVEAIGQLPWEENQLVPLAEQMESLVFVPQVPGSYFTSRAVNSAFMTSVLNSKNPTEQLLYWSEQIDQELARKSKEFE